MLILENLEVLGLENASETVQAVQRGCKIRQSEHNYDKGVAHHTAVGLVDYLFITNSRLLALTCRALHFRHPFRDFR